jgi:hypothetical protein
VINWLLEPGAEPDGVLKIGGCQFASKVAFGSEDFLQDFRRIAFPWYLFLLECSGQGKHEQYSRGKVADSYRFHRIAKNLPGAHFSGLRRSIGLIHGGFE